MNQDDDKKMKAFVKQAGPVHLAKPEGEWREIVAKIETFESKSGVYLWRRWLFGSFVAAAAALVFGLALQNHQTSDRELADFVINSQPVDEVESNESGFEDDYLSLLE